MGPMERSAKERAQYRELLINPPTLKAEPAWRAVVLKYLPPDMTLGDFYDRMGWKNNTAYWQRRNPHVKLCIAAQMAKACRAPMGEFLVALANAEGIPNLGERVRFRRRRDTAA